MENMLIKALKHIAYFCSCATIRMALEAPCFMVVCAWLKFVNTIVLKPPRGLSF